ncbi:TRAM domain-containing protein [Eubacteriales bacterium OttesenSCG-928-M02]|nr:TRAM domain-containing protein [Eubacteriales bacterium OttesenSCG-928-M02]
MQRAIRWFVAVLGIFAGIGLVIGLISILRYFGVNTDTAIFTGLPLFSMYAVGGIFGGLFFYVMEPALVRMLKRLATYVDETLSQIPTKDVFIGIIGLIIGLVIALLLSTLINQIPIPWLSVVLSITVYIAMGYLGISTALRRKNDLPTAEQLGAMVNRPRTARQDRNIPPKILDTSVIIDGRIYEVAKTGVIEGRIIVPEFVLGELRHIADSADPLRRQRGRRGLDILAEMQKDLSNVTVSDKDYEGIEVDEKLIRLATDMRGKIVTNDLNLNKVADVKEVDVININAIADAVKAPVLPGEVLNVQVIREGKEPGQGLAYLDDGTMIVVDGGAKRIGDMVDATITSVLQTGAGRMIFARLSA